MFFKSRISAIMLKESQIPELLPFKSIEDFNFSSETFFKKNLFMDNKNIKSPFAELNWRSKAKKIVLGFVSKDVWEVLLKNKEFLLEERVILFMVGACEGLKNELGENIMEFEWDEVERVAHTIEKLLVK